MADLACQIADLQAEFQGIARSDPWVCLAIPPLGRGLGSLSVGELTWPALPQLPPQAERMPTILDERGRPLDRCGATFAERLRQHWKILDEYGPLGPPWVRTLKDPRLRPI